MTHLERAVEFRLATPAEDGDGRTLTGYAAVFNEPTRIDSWEGTFLEDIRAGAFRKTIRERTPVLQFEHGRHPLVGSLPIGRVDTLREDTTGLYVEARLTDSWVTDPVRLAIEDGSITGMSFRFEVVREEWRDNSGKRLTDPSEIQRLLWEPGERGPLQRTLVELRLFELGPVVFPAYEATSVGVRMAEAIRCADPALVRAARASILEATVELDVEAARSLLVPPLDEEIPAAPPLTATTFTYATGVNTTAPSLTTYSTSLTSTGYRADSSTEDAPPAVEHPDPSLEETAPLEEHPSSSTHDSRQAYMRRAYLRSLQ